MYIIYNNNLIHYIVCIYIFFFFNTQKCWTGIPTFYWNIACIFGLRWSTLLHLLGLCPTTSTDECPLGPPTVQSGLRRGQSQSRGVLRWVMAASILGLQKLQELGDPTAHHLSQAMSWLGAVGTSIMSPTASIFNISNIISTNIGKSMQVPSHWHGTWAQGKSLVNCSALSSMLL